MLGTELYPELIFCGTFLISIPFASYLTRIGEEVGKNPAVFWTNQVFVEKHGFAWFTVAFLSNMFMYSVDNKIPVHVISYFLQLYAADTGVYIILTSWCFGDSLFERIAKKTGGNCLEKFIFVFCTDEAGGFDVSGHYYFITTSTLLLVSEIWRIRRIENKEKLKMCIVLSSLVLIIVWFSAFVVTSFFFHTIAEKFVGLLLGLGMARLLKWKVPSLD